MADKLEVTANALPVLGSIASVFSLTYYASHNAWVALQAVALYILTMSHIQNMLEGRGRNEANYNPTHLAE